MNTKYIKLIALITILTIPGISLGQVSVDRLLPTSIINDIEISWKQDGRAVDIVLINNNKSWFITSMNFLVTNDKNQIDIVNNNGKTPLTLENFRNYSVEESTSYLVPLRLSPGAKRNTHIELNNEARVNKLSLKEIRGREVTFFDKARSILD